MGRKMQLEAGMVNGFELFSEYEKVKRHMIHSSILTAHLATEHLAPDGYLLFNSQLSAYDHTKIARSAGTPSPLDFIASATTAK